MIWTESFLPYVEAVVHMLQAITSRDATKTITQIDGVGAFDHARRATMLQALAQTPTAHSLLPFVLMTYGKQSKYLWRDDSGQTFDIVQGEGIEQGDALSPALFSLGLAGALHAAQFRLAQTGRKSPLHHLYQRRCCKWRNLHFQP